MANKKSNDDRRKNIINDSLIERNKIIFPSLHIKFVLMEQFVKALNNEECFFNFCRFSPKLRAGIFDGLQIRKLTNDPSFDYS